MVQIGEAYVAIRPDTKGFSGQVQKDVEPALANLKRMAGQVLSGLAIGAVVKGGIDELKQQQSVLAQTDARLQSTGNAAHVTAGQVSELAESLQNLSGKDKEAIQAGENMMLTFKSVRNEAGAGNDIFNQATKASLDMSVAFGTDLTGASLQLGKALENPLVGMTALRRSGVSFTAEQIEMVKQFEASGQHMESQKLILKELQTEVGGAAEAYGQTLPGKMERAGNALDDLKATIVSAAVPALEGLSGAAVLVGDGFAGLDQPVQLALLGLGAVVVAGPKVVAAVQSMAAGSGALSAAMGGVAAVGIAALLAGMAKVQAESKAMQEQLHGDIDFSDYAKAASGINEEGKAVDKLGDSWNKMSAAEKLRNPGAWKVYIDAADQYDADLKHIASNEGRIQDLGKQLGISAGAAQHLTDSMHLDLSSMDPAKYTPILRGLQDGSISAADGAKQLAAQTKSVGSSADDAAPQVKSLTDEISAMNDAEKAILDPQFAAVEAANKLDEAQANYNKALSEHGKGSSEEIDAAKALAKANADVDYSFRQLQTADDATGVGSGDIFQQWIDRGTITASAVDTVGTKFDQVKAKADAFNGSTFTATVDVNTAPAEAAFGRLHDGLAALKAQIEQDLPGLPGAIPGSDLGGILPPLRLGTPHAASGGVVPARTGGTLVTVGEGGKDEAIIPLPKSGMMGGSTINIYDARDPVRTAFTVRRELRRASYGAVA